MRNRALLGVVCTVFLVSGAAAAKKAAEFSRKLSDGEKVQQALNRLTFGPRPGDAQQVAKTGLKKWMDGQLHPERLPESPVLQEKLQHLDSLRMSSAELVQNYPTPQTARDMVSGRIPFPPDPERRRAIQKLVARAERKEGDDAKSSAPEPPKLEDLLTRDEIRRLRGGSAQDRMVMLNAMPPEKLDDVIAALPPSARQNLFLVATPEIRRRITLTNGPQQVVSRDLAEGKLLRPIYSNRQLEEVLVDFWFNHFNIFIDK